MKYPHAELTERVIGAAIEVHRVLGPGLLESVYEECLGYELAQLGVPFVRQVELPIRYKEATLNISYRLDMLIEDAVVLELKSVTEVTAVHEAQLLTYLRLAKKRVGLLINFNTDLLKHGIKRRVL